MRAKKMPAPRIPACHPDREHYARGQCHPCYDEAREATRRPRGTRAQKQWKTLEPDLDPVQPLAAAATRTRVAGRHRPGRVRGAAVTAQEKGIMMGMRAAGVPSAVVGAALERWSGTVQEVVARDPEAADQVQALRAKLKALKIARAHALEPKLWARAEKEIGEIDPETKQWVVGAEGGAAKDVDAIFRALLASEKVQAAAAGEGNASGAPLPGSQAPAVDLRVLIQALAEP